MARRPRTGQYSLPLLIAAPQFCALPRADCGKTSEAEASPGRSAHAMCGIRLCTPTAAPPEESARAGRRRSGSTKLRAGWVPQPLRAPARQSGSPVERAAENPWTSSGPATVGAQHRFIDRVNRIDREPGERSLPQLHPLCRAYPRRDSHRARLFGLAAQLAPREARIASGCSAGAEGSRRRAREPPPPTVLTLAHR